jgi:hypothetical protein
VLLLATTAEIISSILPLVELNTKIGSNTIFAEGMVGALIRTGLYFVFVILPAAGLANQSGWMVVGAIVERP